MADEQETTGTAVADAPASDTTVASTAASHDPEWDDAPAAPVAAAKTDRNEKPAAEKANAGGAQERDPEPSEPVDEFDAPTLEWAKMLGYDEDEVRAFGSKANLEKAFAKQERLLLARAKGEKAAPATQAPTVTKAAEAPRATADAGLDYTKVEEQLGKEAADVIRVLQQRFDAQLKATKDEYDQRIGVHDQRFVDQQKAYEQQMVAQDLDLVAKTIASMPEKHRALVGTGEKATKTYQEVRDIALALGAGLKAEGQDPSKAIEKLIERGFRSVFSDDIEKITREDIAAKIANRTKTSPPVSRKAKATGDPVADAKAAVREKLMKYGQQVDAKGDENDW